MTVYQEWFENSFESWRPSCKTESRLCCIGWHYQRRAGYLPVVFWWADETMKWKETNFECVDIPVLVSIQLTLYSIPAHRSMNNIKVVRNIDFWNRILEKIVPIKTIGGLSNKLANWRRYTYAITSRKALRRAGSWGKRHLLRMPWIISAWRSFRCSRFLLKSVKVRTFSRSSRSRLSCCKKQMDYQCDVKE